MEMSFQQHISLRYGRALVTQYSGRVFANFKYDIADATLHFFQYKLRLGWLFKLEILLTSTKLIPQDS